MISVHACAVTCFSDNNEFKRLKRSELSIFQKVKSGLSTAGNSVSDFFATGYEEVKNVFSSDRQLGDYTVNKLDVRFGEDEDEDINKNELIENHDKIHLETDTENVRSKRELHHSVGSPAAELREVDSDEINKDISATTASE